MERVDRIRKELQKLNPSVLEIVNSSQNHSKHHVDHINNGQTHFSIKISAEKLNSLTRLFQHRLINKLLAKEFSEGLHALSIKVI